MLQDVSHTGTDVSFSIGQVSVRVRDPGRCWRFGPEDPHKRFVIEENGKADISITVSRGAAPALPAGTPVYTTEGGLWNLFREGSDLVFALGAPAENGAIHRVARVDAGVSSGEVIITPEGDRPGFHPYPLRYPLDELLMINHLAKGRGTIVHACGVVTPDGEGWLFVGRSGAGKSTLSDLWEGRAGADLLSDDRIIVRPAESGFRMYGTPWHGDARASSPASAPLTRIFLLRHGASNHLVPASPEDAVETILLNCFAPFYDADGMRWTLQMLGDMAERLPVAHFHFLPDSTAISYLLEEVRK
jgi:hypothetical protein